MQQGVAMSTTSPNTTGPAKLRERTVSFAKKARAFISKTPRTIASLSDCRRLIYSTGNIGACYIAADEAHSREAFMRSLRDCRREAKQSAHWLQLLAGGMEEQSEKTRSGLEAEALELDSIFGRIIGSMLNKSKDKVAAEAVAA